LVHDVDHDERLQLERVGSISPVDVMEQLQLQLDFAQLALMLSGELLHEDQLQLDFV